MIYGEPTKDEEGLRWVKTTTDGGRKVYVQLNGVKIEKIEGDEITIDLVSKVNEDRIAAVHELNREAATENSESWFGKVVSEGTLSKAYNTGAKDKLTVDRIEATRVFTVDQEQTDFESIMTDSECSAIVELGGIWFGKKTFAPAWNLVQVRIELPPPQPEETYPEQYAFKDESEADQ
jgi:hypothetical protein